MYKGSLVGRCVAKGKNIDDGRSCNEKTGRNGMAWYHRVKEDGTTDWVSLEMQAAAQLRYATTTALPATNPPAAPTEATPPQPPQLELATSKLAQAQKDEATVCAGQRRRRDDDVDPPPSANDATHHPTCPEQEHDECCSCKSDEFLQGEGDWDNGSCCGHCYDVCRGGGGGDDDLFGDLGDLGVDLGGIMEMMGGLTSALPASWDIDGLFSGQWTPSPEDFADLDIGAIMGAMATMPGDVGGEIMNGVTAMMGSLGDIDLGDPNGGGGG